MASRKKLNMSLKKYIFLINIDILISINWHYTNYSKLFGISDLGRPDEGGYIKFFFENYSYPKYHPF